MAQPAIGALKRDFAAHLADLGQKKSVASIHRYLRDNGFTKSSISTFRREWGEGAQAWVERLTALRNVRKIASVLGRDAMVYDAALAEIERLREASNVHVPTVMANICQMEIPPIPGR